MKYIQKGLLVIFLSYVLILQGCSLAWIGTLDTILAVAAPALNNVITIVDLSENKPVDQTLETKITNDAANLKLLAAQFAAASGPTPTSCQEVQAAVAVLNDDSAVVLQLVQASGSTNFAAILAAADAFVVVITGLIPQCNTPAAVAKSKASVSKKLAKVNVSAMIDNYNNALTKPTGKSAVDAYTKANKLHKPNLFVRAYRDLYYSK